jgi:DNA-directed RNA polymerase specialized sigma24 family protein
MNFKLKEIKMMDSYPKYPIDYQFAQLLASGNTNAWDRFYREIRKKISIFLNKKYPGVFNEVIIEEICDGVQNRLSKSNYKVLREYRGDCSFSLFITRATDWEVKDWLRKHSEELLAEPVDTTSTYKVAEPYSYLSSLQEHEEVIPVEIKALSDDLRWAFLLRYYDYFGFPLEEVRKLAKKKRVHIGSITQKLVKLLEPEGEDILSVQREKQKKFELRLQKLCIEIQKLHKIEQKLLTSIEEHDLYNLPKDQEAFKKIDVVRQRLLKIEGKRKALLQNKLCVPITTPYEVIAEILGEENVSTIRSRVFLAKKQLGEKISKKNE